LKFPGENARWGFGEVFSILLLIIGAGITYGYWGPPLVAYLVYHQVIAGTLTDEFVIGYIVQFSVTVGGVLFFALLVRRDSLRSLGLRKVLPRDVFNWGVGGGVFLFITILVMGALLEHLVPELPPQPFEQVLKGVTDLREFLVLLVLVSVFAPLAEEMYFRGFVYPVFRQRVGVTAGIIFSGLFFGVAHWDLWRLVPLALGGVGLAVIYEKSRSLYPCWLAHGLWNGAMGIIYYLAYLR